MSKFKIEMGLNPFFVRASAQTVLTMRDDFLGIES